MNEFFNGLGRASGVIAGFLPIAMSFGAIALQLDLSALETLAMSLWIFAGASQFAVLEAIRQGLPWVSIVITVLIINLRHIPMSFATQPLYSRFGRFRHWVLCHGLVDETFALEAAEPPRSFLYYLGMHLSCWVAWVGGTAIGHQFGVLIPERWLVFALPSLFLCLLVNSAKQYQQREMAIVLGLGLAVVYITQDWGATGVLIAILSIAMATSRFPQLNAPRRDTPRSEHRGH